MLRTLLDPLLALLGWTRSISVAGEKRCLSVFLIAVGETDTAAPYAHTGVGRTQMHHALSALRLKIQDEPVVVLAPQESYLTVPRAVHEMVDQIRLCTGARVYRRRLPSMAQLVDANVRSVQNWAETAHQLRNSLSLSDDSPLHLVVVGKAAQLRERLPLPITEGTLARVVVRYDSSNSAVLHREYC
jgi:hypothetical protein